MRPKIEIDKASAQALIRGFDKFDRVAQKRVWDMMLEAGTRTHNEATRAAPKGKTSGLHTGMKTENRKSMLEVSVFSIYEYAPFVEFGTGTKVSVPEGYKDFAMQFYRGPGHNQKDQPFLIPAFERSTQRMTNAIDKMLEVEAKK